MTGASPVSTHRDGAVIQISVLPRASRSEIAGLHADTLRVRIAAPPVDGAANAEVIALLAKRLGISKSRLELLSGQTGRKKRVLIRGLEADEVSAVLLP